MASGDSDPRLGGAEARRLRALFPYLLFALSPLLVFPWAMLRAGMMDGGDDKLANLPLMLHSARQVLKLEFLWTPQLWMGMPLLAEPEAAVLYPFRFVLLLFPPVFAYGVFMWSHYVLAQCSMYWYARLVGLSRGAATFGAVAYGFCGFMMGHRTHVIFVIAGAFGPLHLYFVRRAIGGVGSLRWAYVGASLSFAMVVFGGAIQAAAYLAAMSIGLSAAEAWFARTTKPLVVAALALALSLLVASLQLLPSIEYARELASAPRFDYEFTNTLSWSPLLASTLVLPLSPSRSSELYSRCGVVVLAAALAACVAWPKAKPLTRAWALIAALALLLMMGRFVPPLARLTHALPFVSVLRGPVRHNYEFGIAVAMLAAFGLDQVFGAVFPRSKVLVATAYVLGSGVVSLGLFLLIPRLGDAKAKDFVEGLTPVFIRWPILYAGIASAAWLIVRRLSARRSAWAASLAIAAVLLEARAALHENSWFWDNADRSPIPSEFPETRDGFARIVPPHITMAISAGLGGDSALYLDGVQDLHGYVSIAPQDAVTMLDLDMHGHTRHHDDLVWSSLPSIYGVTHVIMPEVVCGNVRVALDPGSTGRDACGAAPAPFELPAKRKLACAVSLKGQALRYRVDADVRVLGAGDEPVVMGLFDPKQNLNKSAASFLPRELSRDFTTHGGEVRAIRLPEVVTFAMYTDGGTPVELRKPTLTARGFSPLADLFAGGRLRGHARVVEGSLVLDGPAEVARVEKAFARPVVLGGSAAPTMRLELEARAPLPSTGSLVIDLYRDPDFDPEDAQLVAQLADLPATWTALHKEFRLTRAPGEMLVRLFQEGSGVVEVRAARLLVEQSSLLFAPDATPMQGAAFRVSGDTIQLEANGAAQVNLYLPIRPITVEFETEAFADSPSAPLRFGIAPEEQDPDDRTELSVPPGRLLDHQRFSRTVAFSADTTEANLSAYTDGAAPAHVRSLRAEDACLRRRYEPVRRLGGGLWVYRNPDAMPRAFTVSKLVSAGDGEQARAILRDEADFDPKTTAVVESPPEEALSQGSIESASFGASTVGAWVNAPRGPTFLVVNDRFDAHWRATVDGMPARILRTNGLVRGVRVPSGRHHVTMAYRAPISVWVGLFLSALGVFLGAFVAPRLRWGQLQSP